MVVKVLGGSLLSNVNCYCYWEVIWLVYIGVGRWFSHLIGIGIQQYLHSNILLIPPHVLNSPLNSSFNSTPTFIPPPHIKTLISPIISLAVIMAAYHRNSTTASAIPSHYTSYCYPMRNHLGIHSASPYSRHSPCTISISPLNLC